MPHPTIFPASADSEHDAQIEHALFRLHLVYEIVRANHEVTASTQASLLRALRELHRSLSVSPIADQYDPDRNIRYVLWNGFRSLKRRFDGVSL